MMTSLRNLRVSRYLLVFILAWVSITSYAARAYNPVTQQAQTNLATQGYNPGDLDGIQGKATTDAIKSFQQKESIPATGKLDAATLEKMKIGTAVDTVNKVEDWKALPTQAEMDELIKKGSAYSDYKPKTPSANFDIPGKAILAAMNKSADTFGSRRKGEPAHTNDGYNYMTQCLKTGYTPTHWSDLTIHYYCQMSLPRQCYTYASSGQSTGGVRMPRTQAYAGCAAGKLDKAADFAWVVKNQPVEFQFVMFGQTHAFNHEQSQAVINAYYGVSDPANKKECNEKRPRRTEDPTDGSHCLVNKTMSKTLVGKGT